MATLTERQILASELARVFNLRGRVEKALQQYRTFQFHRKGLEEV